MKQSITTFLEFKGKNLLFLSNDGVYYVALKPICEALNIEYTRIFKNVKSDAILSPALAIQPMQVPNDQVRKMMCLPEKYIYAWIFSIRSESKELLEYKKLCYDILYDYFHGTITNRKDLLQKRAKIKTELHEVTAELKSNELYNKVEFLKAENMRIAKELIANDNETIFEQTKLTLFDEISN